MSKKHKKNRKHVSDIIQSDKQTVQNNKQITQISAVPVTKISSGAMVKYSYPKKKACHVGPIEIVPNLWIGSMRESAKMRDMGVKTLIPLDSLRGNVWDMGWRGEILYYPIDDFSTLPKDVAIQAVNEIVARLDLKISVGIFCQGGHGRTGYLTSLVLGRLGYEDPINFLRQNYCTEAVESASQIRQIADIIGNPKLLETYKDDLNPRSSWKWGGYMGYGYDWDDWRYEYNYCNKDAFNDPIYPKDFPIEDEDKESEPKGVSDECKKCAFFTVPDTCDIYGISNDTRLPCPEFYSLEDYLDSLADMKSRKEV